jgi:hypothetical protein
MLGSRGHLAFALVATIGACAVGCSLLSIAPYPDDGTDATLADAAERDAGRDAAQAGETGRDSARETGTDTARGCEASTDCLLGHACDPSDGRCSKHCLPEAGITCNGGCCNGDLCVDGTLQAECGANGGACVVCTGNGTVCVGGSCGCRNETDCQAYNACTLGKCSGECGGPSSTACNGGCCNSGVCAVGNAATACGLSGACVSCYPGICFNSFDLTCIF